MSDTVPPWAYAKPGVRSHDPRLISLAATEKARLTVVLAAWRLAAEQADDREAYTEGKGEFVRDALGRDAR